MHVSTVTSTYVGSKHDWHLTTLATEGKVAGLASNTVATLSICTCRPMIICLGLKDHSMETIRELVKTINENNTWSALAPESP